MLWQSVCYSSNRKLRLSQPQNGSIDLNYVIKATTLLPPSLSLSLSPHHPFEQSQRRTLIGLAWVKCPTIEPIIPIHGRGHNDKRELPESPADPSPPTMWSGSLTRRHEKSDILQRGKWYCSDTGNKRPSMTILPARPAQPQQVLSQYINLNFRGDYQLRTTIHLLFYQHGYTHLPTLADAQLILVSL